MYSVRKILALILALAMVFAMSASVFAASFADLKDHWSKPYMEDLYERGLLTGYPDSTMKPENNITGAEALTFLAKLYTTTAAEDAAIHADFGKTVDAVTSTAWVKSFIEKALAAGIVTEDELNAMALFEPIAKEQLALFIVRAIKMQDQAALLEGTELTFADVENISKECFGSIALLTKLEITVGDTNNKFGPEGDVTRAIAATMVSKILTYVEANKTELKIDGYSGISYTEGLLSAVGKKDLTLRDKNGIYYVYEMASDFAATINGSSKTTSIPSSMVGNPAELRLVDGYASLAEITTENGITRSGAKFVQATSKAGAFRVYDYYTGKSASYDAMKANVTIDGAVSLFSGLKAGDYLNLTFTNGELTGIDAVRGSFEIEGEVISIAYGGVVNIVVETQDGDVLLPLNISDLPTISRGDHPSGLDKLAVGDYVKVSYTGGEVTKIVIDVTSATVTGTIVAITQTVESTQWRIEDANGIAHNYTQAKNAVAYNGKNTIQIASLSIGDEVSLVIFDGEITEINLIKAHSTTAAAAEKMNVKVIDVDSSARKLAVINEEGRFFYVQCSYSTSILVTATGKTISVSSLVPDDELVIYGSYDEDGIFNANSIVIENKK